MNFRDVLMLAATQSPGPRLLADSEEITLLSGDGDLNLLESGLYLINTTAGVDTYLRSTNAIGDFLLQIVVQTAPSSGSFFGVDTQAPAGGEAYSDMDESVFPDGGYGPTKFNLTTAAAFTSENHTRNGPIWLTRVGSTLRLSTGPVFWTATQVYTGSAANTNNRYLLIRANAGGRWQVRFIPYPI